jgi:hypothetical protein
VRYLGGNVHSFFYVDYGADRGEFNNALQAPGFRGYSILGRRPVTENELAPDGWQPPPIYPSDKTGSPLDSWIKRPFAEWVVLEREKEYGPDHGPARLSLLYLVADGAAAFHALYHAQNIAPYIVAIIRPGTGFGGNWTDFRQETMIFGRLVLSNPAGIPEFLLCDNHQPYWANHYEAVPIWARRNLALFCRRKKPPT